MSIKDILNAMALSIISVIIAASIVTALDFAFHPSPERLDPLSPLHLSEKWR